MRVSGKVQIDDRWGAYRNDLEQGVARALLRAGAVGMDAGRAKSSRYNISRIQGAVKVDVPVRHPRGWYIDITWTDFRARFFDKGTYQKLGRILSARSKQGGTGNRGVRPGRFTTLARRVGRLALIEALGRELR